MIGSGWWQRLVRRMNNDRFTDATTSLWLTKHFVIHAGVDLTFDLHCLERRLQLDHGFHQRSRGWIGIDFSSWYERDTLKTKN